jgi:hypothetical protein
VRWNDAVLSSLKSYRDRHGTPVIERKAFLDEEKANIESATGTSGATPEQTVSRVLQELRDAGTLESLGRGRYRLLNSPIDVEREDLPDEAMGLGDIRREDVLGAIALLDDPVESPRLLDELHFGPAKDYRLVYKGRFYDSKAVVGIAHGIPADREYLPAGDFSGGVASVVRILAKLGFYVDDGDLYDITRLRVDKTDGRPAPYQYIVLLWAIARAQSGLPRMVRFSDARDELAQILAPFAVTPTAPDAAMPWIALARSTLWELEKPSGATSVTESDVKLLNLAGGLSTSVYNRVAQKDSYKGFVGARPARQWPGPFNGPRSRCFDRPRPSGRCCGLRE